MKPQTTEGPRKPLIKMAHGVCVVWGPANPKRVIVSRYSSYHSCTSSWLLPTQPALRPVIGASWTRQATLCWGLPREGLRGPVKSLTPHKGPEGQQGRPSWAGRREAGGWGTPGARRELNIIGTATEGGGRREGTGSRVLSLLQA